MKKQILSLAAAVSLGASAFAAVPTDTWNSGELLLSFASTTSATNMVVNLGSFSQFATFDGATTNLTRLNVADLASTFTGSWNSDANLKWAIAGSTLTTVNTAATGGVLGESVIFTVSPRLNIGDSPVSISAQTQSTQNSDISDISGAGTGYNISDTAGFSNTFTVGIAKNNADSFFTRQSTSTPRFGTGQDQTAVGTTIVDLYGLTPASGVGSTDTTATGWNTRGATLLGSFQLSSSGLSYTAVTAVPEPSSFAAIGGLAVLGFAASRRRRVQA